MSDDGARPGRDDGADDGIADGSDDESVPPFAELPAPLRTACLVLALEVLALVGVAVWLVFDTALGHTPHTVRGLLSAAFALVAAAALGVGARGLRNLSPNARTPVVVLQLLAVPVAYDIVKAGHVGYGAPMLIAVVAVVYLLFTPPVRAVLDRRLDR